MVKLMKKKNIYKILYGLTLTLVLCFMIFVIIDFSCYDSLTFSAPFTAYILVRGLEFLLPGIILFVIGFIIKRKKK